MRMSRRVLPVLVVLLTAFCVSVTSIAQRMPTGAAIDAEVGKILARAHAKGMAVAGD